MNKAKPKLKCEIVTHISVEYGDLEAFIQQVTGHAIEMVVMEEWCNDSEHEIVVDGQLDDYDADKYHRFMESGQNRTSSYSLRAILNGLCKDGHLEAGDYLISVCW